jgi:microcystin-dependent protein
MKNFYKFLNLVLIPIAITFVSFWYIVNFFSFDFFGMETDNFGSTLTTINGSDKISTLPTNLNANFTALNNEKLETSSYFATTTMPNITTLANLATVGTITSGVWSGTALTVGKGGTGSTTLQQYAVLLGNGTGNVNAVQGLGTSGQVLKSNGAGVIPSWGSATIDESINYNWTGQHTGIGIVGEIIAYASSSIPTGWLACNGASVSTTTYSRLFSLIGYMYGGTGANFNLPDLRGRNIIGYGSATTTYDVMGEKSGQDFHVQTEAELAAHTHSFTNGDTSGSAYISKTGTNNTGTFTTGSTGSSQAMMFLDPFIVMQYIIKY